MSSIDKVRDTADAFERIFLIEVMGRNAGFLALNAALSSAADYVVVPEFFESADKEIEKMVQDQIAEMIIGIKIDNQFGPVIIIGSGGIYTELINDSVTLLLPLTGTVILKAINKLKINKLHLSHNLKS